jgi:hypothetical protein
LEEEAKNTGASAHSNASSLGDPSFLATETGAAKKEDTAKKDVIMGAERASSLLSRHAALFLAARSETFPAREEIDPGDGLPSIFNPRGGVHYAEMVLKELSEGIYRGVDPADMAIKRAERDLSVVAAWYEKRTS